jgi:adenine-specific DNA-methyltransferase
MTDILEPEKLELTTVDIAAEKQADLLRLFPEVRTEGGKIDFDRLRLALGETVDVGKERYGMNWPGKADCFKAIQRPSLGTLLPVREESINFDETENLIIEGDNLEVLKLLQKSYQGKVKMIYIDPPYNTGNDFIYPDNYSENLQTYLEYTGQVDSEGRPFSNNKDTDGRFHSKWMNMMYPRLYLARNLLQEQGVIFISIDDAEVANLRRICDDIFGEENALPSFIWKRKAGGGDDSDHVATEHEYILCYARDESRTLFGTIKHESPSMTAKYNRSEGNRRYYLERMDKTSLTYSGSMDFPIECPDGSFVKPPQPDPNNPTTIWRWSKDKIAAERNELIFLQEKKTGEWRIYTKTWESLDGVTARSLLVDKEFGRNRDGTLELAEVLGPKIFSNPKPTKLLRHLLSIAANDSDALLLDFFAGSGSFAQAAMDLNAEDGGNRKFILVQLPEPTEREDYKTIADITKERVRRVIQRHEKKEEGKLNLGDRPKEGFRVLKLATSNFKVWNAGTDTATPETLGQQLELHINHLQAERTGEDLLYEILLKSGFPLTTPVQSITVEGISVYSVANGAMLICLDKALTHEAIKGMAELKPERVVCLDEGFAGNDQLKTNAVLLMKAKGVTKFQTI